MRESLPPRKLYRLLRRTAVTAFAASMFGLALYFLYRELHHYSWSDLIDSFQKIPPLRLASAAAFTALNYAILVGYDFLATRNQRERVPLRRAALASFIGYSVAHNFGSTVGGPAARFRLYTAWGLSPFEAIRVIATVSLTFWIGLAALSGVMFLFHPPPLPLRAPVAEATLRAIGAVLLGATIVYLLFNAYHHKPLRWKKWEVTFPGVGFALRQMAVVTLDLTTASSVLYVLMADETTPAFHLFLGIYLLAIFAIYFSQAPGGLGVFELSVLVLLDADDPLAVAGPLLGFRAIYYLAPLLTAAVLWAIIEAKTFHRTTQKKP